MGTGAGGRRWLPSVRVLLVAVLLVGTVVAVVLTRDAVRSSERDRFEAQTARVDAALADRMTTYVQVLRGGAGLFAASTRVSRLDWDHYVRSLHLEDRYPGFKSLTYAPAVAATDLAAFQRRVRRERLTGTLRPRDALRAYEIRGPTGSSGRPPVHAPILYVAPFTETNRLVLGVDMMREPTRRAVMIRAARTGHAVTSPLLHLSGSDNDEAGFIVYVPISKHGRLLGWLTAAFLAESFAQGVQVARATELDFEARDADGQLLFSTAGTEPDGGPTPLGDSVEHADFTRSSTVAVPGARWSVRYATPDGFVPWRLGAAPWLVGGSGLLLTLVVWFVATGAINSRRRALLLADQAIVLRRAREDAEVAARAKSAFLATMSHEIRSPLHALLAAGTSLSRDPAGPDAARSARVVRASGEHLLHVINGVLDWSKVEAGEIELERLPLELGETLQVVADLVRSRAEERGLELRIVAETPCWLWGDPTRLRQVLLNLVSNAVTHTDEGWVEVCAEVDGDRVRFAVQDSGVGIPSDRVPRIFEAFGQAEASTARLRGGTGLGLPIAARLVARMGGELDVDTAPGHGSRFSFELPFEPAPAPAAPERPAGDPEPAPMRALAILVAEDESVNQIIVRAMLEKLGQEPHLVGDGAEALAALDERRFDVALLDLSMPVMGGLEVAEEIRRRPGPQPRLIAMTANSTPTDREAALAAGFDELLAKPYTVADLERALRARRDP